MGQSDIPLNETGRQQIQDAAKILAGHTIASLCYSPLLRTKESAKIVAQRCPCSLYLVKNLMERRWGELEGKVVSSKDILDLQVLPQNAESMDDFRVRVLEGLKEIASYPDPVLIVSHQGVLEVIYEKLGLNLSMIDNIFLLHIFQQLGKWQFEELTL